MAVFPDTEHTHQSLPEQFIPPMMNQRQCPHTNSLPEENQPRLLPLMESSQQGQVYMVHSAKDGAAWLSAMETSPVAGIGTCATKLEVATPHLNPPH